MGKNTRLRLVFSPTLLWCSTASCVLYNRTVTVEASLFVNQRLKYRRPVGVLRRCFPRYIYLSQEVQNIIFRNIHLLLQVKNPHYSHSSRTEKAGQVTDFGPPQKHSARLAHLLPFQLTINGKKREIYI